jgi:hypothetical protein
MGSGPGSARRDEARREESRREETRNDEPKQTAHPTPAWLDSLVKE